MYSLSSYVSLGLFPLSLCVIVCDQQDVLFSSPVISALFAHRGTLIYLSKTRLERLHPISCFKSPVCDNTVVVTCSGGRVITALRSVPQTLSDLVISAN